MFPKLFFNLKHSAPGNLKITEEKNLPFTALINPNPVTGGSLKIRINSRKACNVQLSILSADGKIMNSQKIDAGAGKTDKTVNIGQLNSGKYFVRLQTGQKQLTLQFVKAD